MYSVNNQKMNDIIRFRYDTPKGFSKEIKDKVRRGEWSGETALSKIMGLFSLTFDGVKGGALFHGLDGNGSFEEIDPAIYMFEILGLLKKYDPNPDHQELYQEARDSILDESKKLHPAGTSVIENLFKDE